MDPANFSELRKWITEAGLAGKSETAMLDGFCRRAGAAGLPVARAMVIIDTLHPVHEGRVARWRSEGDEGRAELIEYGPSSEGEAAENWRRSPFFRLLESDAGQRVLRGLIRRGLAEKINAVLWYSDLREFTRITDRAAPEQIIPLLNDYAEAVISTSYDNGGDVLKLIGDGTLAIFTAT